MKYTVERTLKTTDGFTCQFFNNVFAGLIYDMRNKIGRLFTEDEYHNLKFVMNIPLYEEYTIVCRTSGHVPDMYRGIRIILDPTLYVDTSRSGIVRLVYEGCADPLKIYDEFIRVPLGKPVINLDRGHGFQKAPHIDHVKFNGPATIVFWKDGTKTVVKYDGKGRKDRKQAILYAFIRKIYGEGRPYHNILNEIEEAVK